MSDALDPLAPLHSEDVGALRVTVHQTVNGRLVARVARVADGAILYQIDGGGILRVPELAELGRRRARAIGLAAEPEMHERPAADADGAP